MFEYIFFGIYTILIFLLGVHIPGVILKKYSEKEVIEIDNKKFIEEKTKENETLESFSNLSDEIIDEWQNGGDANEQQ